MNDSTSEPPFEDQSEVEALAAEVAELRFTLQDMLGHIWDLVDNAIQRLEEYLSRQNPEPEYNPCQYELPFEEPVDYSHVPF